MTFLKLKEMIFCLEIFAFIRASDISAFKDSDSSKSPLLNITHLVHARLCSPLPTLLSPEIKHNPERTPQDVKTHIQHDW